jgi:hypothetical protein
MALGQYSRLPAVHNLAETEFSSKRASHRRDVRPCCCVPMPPARSVLAFRRSWHVPPKRSGNCAKSVAVLKRFQPFQGRHIRENICMDVFAMNRRCRSCRSLKLFFVLFYKDFAPTALTAACSAPQIVGENVVADFHIRSSAFALKCDNPRAFPSNM